MRIMDVFLAGADEHFRYFLRVGYVAGCKDADFGQWIEVSTTDLLNQSEFQVKR